MRVALNRYNIMNAPQGNSDHHRCILFFLESVHFLENSTRKLSSYFILIIILIIMHHLQRHHRHHESALMIYISIVLQSKSLPCNYCQEHQKQQNGLSHAFDLFWIGPDPPFGLPASLFSIRPFDKPHIIPNPVTSITLASFFLQRWV